MLSYRATNFFCFFLFILLNSCVSAGQISGIKILEEGQQKKYTLIKTSVFKREATILKDTTNEFNRFTTKGAVKQYIPSLADVQMYEEILKNNFVANNEIVNSSEVNAENIIQYFKTFNRQYSGYIDQTGDTIIVVNFLDFSNKKSANEIFFNWKYENAYYGSVIYLHKKSPSIYCYALNLRTKLLSRYKI